MSQRSNVVVFLTLGLAAVLASACGEDGDDGGGAGTSGSAGTSAGSGGKGGSSGSSAESGGTSGSAGKGGSSSGSGGTSGKGGAGGVSGSAGKGGAGGGGAGKGGSSGAAGRGGSGGSAGAPDCEVVQCIRPIDCVEVCGGPVLKSSCCPCDEGTFDNFECDGAGGGGSRRGFGGAPGEPSGGAGAGFDPSDLNSDCVDDTCPEGLTPIHYYGIAGPGGPEFCSCSIPCEFGPDDCPDGTTCVNVSDGPGNVCWS